MVLGQIYGLLNLGHKFCQKYRYLQCVSSSISRWWQVVSMVSIVSWDGNIIPGGYISLKAHFGQQMNWFMTQEYWYNSQFLEKFMVQIWAALNSAQDHKHKWPMPMASLLSNAASPTYQSFSRVSCDISSGWASKGDTFTEVSNMKYALL